MGFPIGATTKWGQRRWIKLKAGGMDDHTLILVQRDGFNTGGIPI